MDKEKEFQEKLVKLIDEYVNGYGLSPTVAMEIMDDEMDELAGEVMLRANPEPEKWRA